VLAGEGSAARHLTFLTFARRMHAKAAVYPGRHDPV
jgi:hypothetical protein